MATPQKQKQLRKTKKPPKKFRLSYSLTLLFAMIVVGSVAGLVSYRFGKQALEGVNSSPAGIKMPKASPSAKPKDTNKATPQSQNDGKTSFFLDENEVIAEMQARSQQELGGLTRPAFVAKANISDRKKIYTKVDRAYNYMRDPLAISGDADERIAVRIATLRQRVYNRSRAYDNNFDRRVASSANTMTILSSSSSANSSSTPVELTPIRSRWEDRDNDLVSPNKDNNVEFKKAKPDPTSSFFIDEQKPSGAAERNQR
jgi:hypothetical protein